MKSKALGAGFATTDNAVGIARGELHPISTLSVPYIDNVPLSVLGEVLADEGESLRSFRRAMDRVVEDMEAASDQPRQQPSFGISRETFLTTNSTSSGHMRAYHEDESPLCGWSGSGDRCDQSGSCIWHGRTRGDHGAAGGLSTALAELWQTAEEKKQLRKSPVYWLWKIGSRTNAA